MSPSCRGLELADLPAVELALARLSEVVGVGHVLAAMAIDRPIPFPLIPFAFTRSWRRKKVSGSSPSLKSPESGVGHAEEEDALAFLLRASFARREQSDLARAAKSAQVSPNALATPRREEAADVLDEDEPRARLDKDPSGRSPEISRIISAEALAGEGMGLARDAANDAIHCATPTAAAEGSGIRPHRRWSQETSLHRFDQVRDGEGFPLHQTDCSSSWASELDAEVETTASGAEGDDAEMVGT